MAVLRQSQREGSRRCCKGFTPFKGFVSGSTPSVDSLIISAKYLKKRDVSGFLKQMLIEGVQNYLQKHCTQDNITSSKNVLNSIRFHGIVVVCRLKDASNVRSGVARYITSKIPRLHTVWCVQSGQTRRSLFLGRLRVYTRSDCCSGTV